MITPAKQKLADGGLVILANPRHPSPGLVEMLGEIGFDAVFLDQEHGPADLERTADMIRAARLTGMTPVIRCWAREDWMITRYLDIGAEGIMVPRVDTADQARFIVETVRYARIKDHADKLLIAQIESAEALENLPEMLKVDGLDVFFIGPDDLSKSLGYPGEHRHPEVVKAIHEAIRGIAKAGKVPGILVTEETAAEYRDIGARVLYVHAMQFLARAAGSFLTDIRT